MAKSLLNASAQGVLSAAARKPLSPGQIEILSLYISSLEAKVETHERWAQDHEAALAADHLELRLSGDGTLLVGFPGQHQVRVPGGITGGDKSFAWDLVTRLLRERQGKGQRHTIGMSGAPTQHELRVLAQAAKAGGRKATQCPPPKREASREDLVSILAEIKL